MDSVGQAVRVNRWPPSLPRPGAGVHGQAVGGPRRVRVLGVLVSRTLGVGSGRVMSGAGASTSDGTETWMATPAKCVKQTAQWISTGQPSSVWGRRLTLTHIAATSKQASAINHRRPHKATRQANPAQGGRQSPWLAGGSRALLMTGSPLPKRHLRGRPQVHLLRLSSRWASSRVSRPRAAPRRRRRARATHAPSGNPRSTCFCGTRACPSLRTKRRSSECAVSNRSARMSHVQPGCRSKSRTR